MGLPAIHFERVTVIQSIINSNQKHITCKMVLHTPIDKLCKCMNKITFIQIRVVQP